MIVGGQTEARAQLSSTIIDYHEPFDQGFKVLKKLVSGVFAVKHGKSVINISIPKCRVKSGTVDYPFFFKVQYICSIFRF